MTTTWLGDHALVQHYKKYFEDEVAKLGFVSDFVVTVHRGPDAPSLDAARYEVQIENTTSKSRVTLEGGGGRDRVMEYIRFAKSPNSPQ